MKFLVVLALVAAATAEPEADAQYGVYSPFAYSGIYNGAYSRPFAYNYGAYSGYTGYTNGYRFVKREAEAEAEPQYAYSSLYNGAYNTPFTTYNYGATPFNTYTAGVYRPFNYNYGFRYVKREAEAEAEPQFYGAVPYAYGHVATPAVVGHVAAPAVYGHVATPFYHHGVYAAPVPVVAPTATVSIQTAEGAPKGYRAYSAGAVHSVNKREADAEAQVYGYGVPAFYNAYNAYNGYNTAAYSAYRPAYNYYGGNY